ncbi:MAG: glycoside hydrolase [Oscillospiraceae bacterium]|nr:glycoside hydrolase [Oscillospiraceae bacterium]
MKRTKLTTAASLLMAAAIAVPMMAVPQMQEVTNAAEILKYEFEDGATEGGTIYTEGWAGNTAEDGTGEDFDLTNFSGTGFSYVDQKGTTVSVTVEVPEAGLYEMNICYAEPYDPNKKVQYLNINGVNQGEVSFKHNLTFTETSGGVVNLKEGQNTIELKAYWGYTFFDYLTLQPADESLTNLTPTRQLSNPNASDSTKRLYNYLCDVYGEHVLAGQQEYCGSHNYNSWNDPDTYIKDNEAEFEYILEKTGEQPAIRGIDFLAYNTTSDWRDQAPERCIEWVNEYGGIATVSWHWNVPTEEGSTETAFYVESTGNTPFTTFSVTNAVTEGTWEHELILKDIELIAGELQKLEDADVPILWRPLHEAEGAWFWWGAEGPEACKKLYRLLYDQLTNVYGLDNLIWQWTGYTYETSADWYPGDDVVDMVGYDKYNAVDGLPNLSSISSTFYSLVQSTDGEKMVAMTENDSIPSLENLVNDKAAWLYFCPWYMNYLTSEQNNPVENLVEIYQSDYCITLDELPDLKTYPITEGDVQPEETTESSEETSDTADADEVVYGDVNEDGSVSIADVLTLNKNLMIGEELTAASSRNADVDLDGKPTSADALNILKYTVKIIAELPVK